MNCRTFHDLLQQRLDGVDAETPADFPEHARGCPACAGRQRAAARLAEGLRLLAPPVPPADLADRISALVIRKRLTRPRARRRVTIPLALAACLFVALAVRLYWSRHPADPTPGPGPIAQQPDAEPVDLRGSVAEAGGAVVALTTRTADEAVGQTRWLLPPVPSPSLVTSPAPLEPPVRALREAGAGVGVGLEPVAGSARRAVDLFLRDLPMDLGTGNGL